MNVSDLIESSFGAASAERLGREVGLSAADTGRVLRAGIPLQMGALADLARTPEGQAGIGEALASLPAFPGVEDALGSPQEADQLRQAGALLAPALLGEGAGGIPEQVAGGLNRDRVERLLHLSLPLLLSFLGQRGLTASNAGSFLAGGEGGQGNPAATGTDAAPGSLTPEGLIDFLKGPFSGATADRLGRAAGFSGGTAARATQAALPLVLQAIAAKGSTPEGAADLLKRSRDYERLTDAGGGLNAALLADAAETARIEGQGRGVLGPLFPNLDRFTGRLGSAVGGSGANAGRLLALLAPLVLGLLGRRAGQEGLGAAALSRLLGGLGGGLAALLPAGMTGLAPLLAPTPAQTVVAAVPRVTVGAPPAKPASPPPSPPVVATVAPSERRRRGFPRWLIPLLLLLGLGGYWLLQSRPGTAPVGGTATTGAAGTGLQITRPAPGTTLPAEDFVMGGTGPAGDTLRIEEAGEEVARVTVGPDGVWEAAIPAPAPGEHTYTVSGQEETSRQVRINVAGAEGAASPAPDAAAPTSGTTTGAPDGAAPVLTEDAATGDPVQAFAITEPAAGARLPAGSFTLRGTATPGETLQVFEDGISLGNVAVAGDGIWTLEVPSPAAGPHTYRVQGPGGAPLGQVRATVAPAAPTADAASCDRPYTLSISDGQTVSEPFRFGGEG